MLPPFHRAAVARILFLSFKQRDQLLQPPEVIREASCHSWLNAKRLVESAPVVVEVVQRDRVLVKCKARAETRRRMLGTVRRVISSHSTSLGADAIFARRDARMKFTSPVFGSIRAKLRCLSRVELETRAELYSTLRARSCSTRWVAGVASQGLGV